MSIDAFFIDDHLNIRGQLGHALNFIDDGSFGELSEKSFGVVLGKFTSARVFQIRVGFIRESRADECRFTRLSRACQGDDRILLEALSQVCLDLTWNHIVLLNQNSILNQQNNSESPIGSLVLCGN